MRVFLNISRFKKEQDSITYENKSIECKSYADFYNKLVSFLKDQTIHRGEIKEFKVKNMNTGKEEIITFNNMESQLNKYPRGKQRGIKRVAIALHPVLTLDS
ncbi:hypothetical protein L3V83_15160 [Thiotrichales bacterium 19X7-9]|nr:hypothetical protein [Thiotrichales bacterium 19X7-9]